MTPSSQEMESPEIPGRFRASLVEVLGIVVVLTVCVFQLQLLGAVAAAVAMLMGRASASLYLWKPVQKNVAFFSQTA